MVNQMNKVRLTRSTKKIVKVRSFGGFGVNDIYSKLDALLKKKPSKIVLHLGTNNSVMKTSQSILDDILKLKQIIESTLEGAEVIISCPIIRTDNAKAKLTILKFIEKIKHLKVKYLLNDNVNENCLGKKGLHLSEWGGRPVCYQLDKSAAEVLAIIQNICVFHTLTQLQYLVAIPQFHHLLKL